MSEELKKPDSPGIYEVSNKIYHSSPGLSNSHFKTLLQSPAHYQSWLKKERKVTKEMLIGSVVDTLFLDPKSFHEEYAFIPKCDGRTTEGKALMKAFEEGVVGKTIIGKDSDGNYLMDTINEVLVSLTDRVSSSPYLTALFKGVKQRSFYWCDEETGLLCKVRPDCWATDIQTITDLKVTYDASEGAFSGHIAKMMYFMQGAFYLDGVAEAMRQAKDTSFRAPQRFVLTPIEREDPWGMGAYQLDDAAIGLGRKLYKKALRLYKHCLINNEWPGYETKIQTISLPRWAFFNWEFA